MAPLSPSQGRLAPKLTPLPCLASGIAPVGILWDSCQGAESLTGFHESKAVGQPLTVSEDEYAGGAKVGCADFPAPFRAGGIAVKRAYAWRVQGGKPCPSESPI